VCEGAGVEVADDLSRRKRSRNESDLFFNTYKRERMRRLADVTDEC
jgi:hypothetical protein